jgi:hypothetical protein
MWILSRPVLEGLNNKVVLLLPALSIMGAIPVRRAAGIRAREHCSGWAAVRGDVVDVMANGGVLDAGINCAMPCLDDDVHRSIPLGSCVRKPTIFMRLNLYNII